MKVDINSLLRIQSAASSVGKLEMDKLVNAVIFELKNRNPFGIFTFDSFNPRDFWDEYSWWLLNGEMCFVKQNDMFETIKMYIENELDKYNENQLIFLTAFSYYELDEYLDEDNDLIGAKDKGAIIRVCMDNVNSKGCSRNLDILSSEGVYHLANHKASESVIYSAVDTADSILLEHLHTLIDPDEPLTKIARKIVDVFLENVCCELDDIARLINKYNEAFRKFLIKKDVLPELEYIRASILKDLDD